MALITSAATGNFSAGATWTGGVVPGVGDEARASTGHTVTIDVDTTCDEVSNAGTGIFTLADGVTLTANVTNKSTTTSRNCLQFTAASPAIGAIVGNVTGGPASAARGAAITGTGTLNITGNCNGGTVANAEGLFISGAGIVNVTGNCNGGAFGFTPGVWLNAAATLNITGNCNGGSGTGGAANGVYASNANGTVNVTGQSIGGNNSHGIANTTTGTVNLIRSVGNAFGPGNTVNLTATAGVNNLSTGIVQLEEIEYGEYGMSPTSGTGIRLKKLGSNVAIFNYVDAGAAKTLVDATQGQMPAASDVRFGTVYASGALTGSCYVPAAASVAFGVPVDNTTGTAALTAQNVWEYATRTLTAGGISAEDVWTYATREITGGTVDTLVNAPTVPTAEEIATEVWDTQTSALTTSGAIGTRLKNSSTVATTGAQLAAALS